MENPLNLQRLKVTYLTLIIHFTNMKYFSTLLYFLLFLINIPRILLRLFLSRDSFWIVKRNNKNFKRFH